VPPRAPRLHGVADFGFPSGHSLPCPSPGCRQNYVYTECVFEWEPRKAEANAAKHGVSFDDAVTVFLDANAWTAQTCSTRVPKHDFGGSVGQPTGACS
jgi:hypothetical protein